MNMYAYVGNDPVNATDPTGNNALTMAGYAYRGGKLLGNGVNIATKALTGASFSTHIANAIYDAVHNESSVDDLDILHGDEVLGDRPDLEGLSDDDLLDSVNNPSDADDPGLVQGKNGKLKNGNSRARELKNRVNNPDSKINGDTKVPVTIEKNTDSDYFPDLD